jgi:hypothetical protein
MKFIKTKALIENYSPRIYVKKNEEIVTQNKDILT